MDFHSLNKSTKNIILIMMIRTLKPLILTAGPLIKFNFETYIKVNNKKFSFNRILIFYLFFVDTKN